MNIDTFTTFDRLVTNLDHQQERLNSQNDLSRMQEGIDKGKSDDRLAIDIPTTASTTLLDISFFMTGLNLAFWEKN